MSKQLIFINNATFNRFSERLENEGREQVVQTARILEKFLENKKIVTFHSDRNHSVEAARIFNDYFDNKIMTRDNIGLSTDSMPLVGKMLYSRVRQLENIHECAVFWGQEDLLNNQVEMFGWDKLHENPAKASGYIVEVDSWQDVSLVRLKQGSAKQIANFTSCLGVSMVEKPVGKKEKSLKIG